MPGLCFSPSNDNRRISFSIFQVSKRTFRKSSNACGRHSIVLPLIMNAATFSPRYSTILHSFTEGSLVGAGVPPEGGGLSPPPKDLWREPEK